MHAIREREPSALLLLGDSAVDDREGNIGMHRSDYLLRDLSNAWNNLATNLPVYAVWDDHDYFNNDLSGVPHWLNESDRDNVRAVWRQNWNNPAVDDGREGINFHTRLGAVELIMLDTRSYRDYKLRNKRGSFLGEEQLEWLKKTLSERPATFTVICSNVPMAPKVKPGSKDTWDGYGGERQRIYQFIADQQIPGVIILSADRHRSDAYRIDTKIEGMYPLYEFSSSRLTNQHVHRIIKSSLFGYNEKQSFGLLRFDTTMVDPTVTFEIISIDNETIHSLTLKKSDLSHR